jgi:hypothetical protein
MEYLKKIWQITAKKPPVIVISCVLYIIIIAVLKSKFNLSIAPLLFVLGGLIGIYLVDIAEAFVKVEPSPFKTPLFDYAFIVLSFFVISSTGSTLASGIVISIFINIIFNHLQTGNSNQLADMSVKPTFGPLPRDGSKNFFALLVLIFFIETAFLVRF